MTTGADIVGAFRALPLTSVEAVAGRRFAVLAPHPDDESLGCGGIIATACAAGHPPPVLVLTDGSASHPGSAEYPPAVLAALRAREAMAATAALGLPAALLHLIGLPAGAAPHDDAGVARAGDAVAERAAGCDTLLVSWRHDPHCDHLAAYLIARRAAGRLGARLLEYPVWGWRLPRDAPLPATAWHGWRVDIAAHLPAKRRAIAAHRSQHGSVVTDDPKGFVLPAAFLAIFEQPWETLVEAA
jgi:LmbE family N-acetylglucosaminyl deacetylase